MRAIKSMVMIVGLGLSIGASMASQTQLKINQSFHLKNPDNGCVAATFDLQHGKAILKLTNTCPSITALVCTYRSATSAWDCEQPLLNSVGQVWLAPFPAEPSAVYLVGACKNDNASCNDTLHFLYSRIIGRPRSLDPEKLVPPPPPPPCAGSDCPPPPPPPPPPAPERG